MKSNLNFQTLYSNVMPVQKEYIERRIVEPVKFLFVPKMGLLVNQASKKDSIMNYEIVLSCFFYVFMDKNLIIKKITS